MVEIPFGSTEMNKKTLEKLAKTELHCHLDGSLSMAAIRQLAEMATISIPVSDEELKACITASDHVENLEELLTKLQESYAPFL